MRRILFLLLIPAAAQVLGVACAESEPPPDPDLEVFVRSTAGRPLSGVRVGVAPMAGLDAFRMVGAKFDLPAGGVEGMTDDSGRIRFTGLIPGRWFAAGWRRHSQLDMATNLQVPADRPAVLLMEVGGGLTVIACGARPSGLTARVEGYPRLTGVFDADGRARIEGIRPGDIRVLIDGPGWQIEQERILQAGTRRPLIVRPPVGGGPATLTGRVFRGESIQPLRHLQVVFEREGETTRYRGQADEEGRFRLEGLPIGRADIQVGRKGEVPTNKTWRQPVFLEPGANARRAEIREARIRLLVQDAETGKAISSRVRCDGGTLYWPRPGEELYTFENLTDGERTVLVESAGYGPRWIRVVASKSAPVRTVRLSPTLPLVLHVRDEEGAPIPWIRASITDESGHDLARVRMTWFRERLEEGLFGFNLPKGTFDVVVYDRGDRWWQGRITAPVPGGRKEIVLRKE